MLRWLLLLLWLSSLSPTPSSSSVTTPTALATTTGHISLCQGRNASFSSPLRILVHQKKKRQIFSLVLTKGRLTKKGFELLMTVLIIFFSQTHLFPWFQHLFSFSQFQGILLWFFHAQVTAQLDQELQTVNVIRKLRVNHFVTVESLLIVS